MQLLLLLSALLSALTGVGGARAAAPQTVASASVTIARVATQAVRSDAVSRPVVDLPTLASLAHAPLAAVATVTGLPALYTGRRRE